MPGPDPVGDMLKTIEAKSAKLADASAGAHWRKAMDLLATSSVGALDASRLTEREILAGTWAAQLAQAHLAAAHLLLEHDPIPFDERHPVDGPEPSRDWRER